jgi:tripartite-type tricarboxylate transporter receptor subunit TctC
MIDHPLSRRSFLRRTSALAAYAGLSGSALAQSGPDALRMLCTAPGGSIPDTIARRYAEFLSNQNLGAVVVDNRVGAAGQVAVTALKQSAPNGTTLLLAQGAIATVYPYLYAKLGYDPQQDIKPVSLAAEATLGFAVGPAVPSSVNTLREFIDWTRANAKLANYGSPGAGTLPHLVSAMLARESKLEWQHVPYAGGPPAIADLIGGRLASLVLPEGLLRQQHAAGKLRVLATSGNARSALMPTVPTFVEQGFPSLVVREWFGVFAPGATPDAAVAAAAERIRKAASDTTVAGPLREMGMLALASSPREMRDRITQEQRYWEGVVGATGIRLE